MKNDKKYIYYGIVFWFLFETIFNFFERLITTIVFYFSWNIYIIPIFLTFIAIIMILAILRYKSIPQLNLWIVVGIFTAFAGMTLIAPEKWLRNANYLESEKQMLLLVRPFISACFRWIIVLIAYIKYYKLNKQEAPEIE